MITLDALLGLPPGGFAATCDDGAPRLHPGGARLFPFDNHHAQALLAEALPMGQVAVRGLLGPAPPSRYAGEGGQTDPARLRQLGVEERQGIVVHGVHALSPRVSDLCRQLRPDPCTLLRSNLYQTWPGTFAYPLHWDTHGLIALQLAGAKRWTLYRPALPLPLPGQTLERSGLDPATLEAWGTVTLQAGDALWVPRGWAHAVMTVGAADAPSVHITFGLHRASRRDLWALACEEVLDQLSADPDFRQTDGESGPAAPTLAAIEAAVERARTLLHTFAAPRPFHLLRLGGQIELRAGHPAQDQRRSLRLPLREEPALRAFAAGAMPTAAIRPALETLGLLD